ncbi:MAG TPA: hypothetical protein ENN74_01210 [Firmicutes bacterium]|nr:hypothetical protein [Bacillota bacterium]
MMRRSRAILPGLLPLVMAVGLVGGVGVSAEEQVSLEDLPASVRSTIEEYAAGGQIVEVEQEVEDGAIVYEADILKDGVESEIRVAADGRFLGYEQEEGDDEDEGDDDDEDEASLAWDQLPPAVQKTLNSMLQGAQPSELVRGDEDGCLVYEAEYEQDGRKRELKVTEQGEVLEIEEEISPADLPAAISAQIQKRFPGAEIKEAESVIRTFYEVELVWEDGEEREVQLFANGCLLDDDD